MSDELIIHEICSSTGSGESAEVNLVADTSDGKTWLVIEKSITERYDITDYDKVMRLFEQLTGGGGRKVWTLEDLTKNPW